MDHDKNASEGVHPQRDEPILVLLRVVPDRECVIVKEDQRSVSEVDTVLA
jgi:hypothetical protein